MITRIEIDGFKTFQDFAVDLAPFQVIIGPNGCGKSNFFDALDLLSKLADSDLRTAFKSIRGNINELFTVLPNGKNAEHMRFAVEMWADDSGKSRERPLADDYRILRYEIEIRRQETPGGFEHLYISFEKLMSLPATARLQSYTTVVTAANFKAFKTAEHLQIIRKPTEAGYVQEVYLEEKKRHDMSLLPEERSSLQTISFLYMQPGIMRRELRNIRLLRLEASALRSISSYIEEQHISSTGENLPATLARMQVEDKNILKEIARDVANIVPNFANIDVDRNEERKQIALYVNMRDKRRFSIDALSEGTLRILALATLRNDLQMHGVLCFEDPEIGVHPGALKRIVRMLRSMTTDLEDLESLQLPLRQLIVTTQSPELVSELDIQNGELLFAEMVTRMQPGEPPMHVTRMVQVGKEVEGDEAAKSYTLNQVLKYLANADYEAIRDDIQKAGS